MSGVRYALVVLITAAVFGVLALVAVAWGAEPAARYLVHTAHGRVVGRVLPLAIVQMLAYSCAIVAFLWCVAEGFEASRRYR